MMLSVLRRGGMAVALTGVLVLGLAACGTERATTEAQPTPTASTTTPGSDLSDSTLTLRRTGGIAGFHDELTVGTDGKATLKSRGKKPITCTVNPKLRAQIAATADTASREAPPRSKSQGKKGLPTATPDALYLQLVIGGEEIRLDDLRESDQAYRDLFRLMNDVMVSVTALRSGQSATPGSACSS